MCDLTGGYWRLKGLFFSDNGYGFLRIRFCFSLLKNGFFVWIRVVFFNQDTDKSTFRTRLVFQGLDVKRTIL